MHIEFCTFLKLWCLICDCDILCKMKYLEFKTITLNKFTWLLLNLKSVRFRIIFLSVHYNNFTSFYFISFTLNTPLDNDVHMMVIISISGAVKQILFFLFFVMFARYLCLKLLPFLLLLFFKWIIFIISALHCIYFW